MELKEAIDSFVKDWSKIVEVEYLKKGHSIENESFGVKYNSNFAIVYRNHSNGQKSSYAHVALKDGFNKKLGQYYTGDIFKADTWNTPAKHRRGSVFFENPTSCVGPYGVNYLQ